MNLPLKHCLSKSPSLRRWRQILVTFKLKTMSGNSFRRNGHLSQCKTLLGPSDELIGVIYYILDVGVLSITSSLTSTCDVHTWRMVQHLYVCRTCYFYHFDFLKDTWVLSRDKVYTSLAKGKTSGVITKWRTYIIKYIYKNILRIH